MTGIDPIIVITLDIISSIITACTIYIITKKHNKKQSIEIGNAILSVITNNNGKDKRWLREQDGIILPFRMVSSTITGKYNILGGRKYHSQAI